MGAARHRVHRRAARALRAHSRSTAPRAQERTGISRRTPDTMFAGMAPLRRERNGGGLSDASAYLSVDGRHALARALSRRRVERLWPRAVGADGCGGLVFRMAATTAPVACYMPFQWDIARVGKRVQAHLRARRRLRFHNAADSLTLSAAVREGYLKYARKPMADLPLDSARSRPTDAWRSSARAGAPRAAVKLGAEWLLHGAGQSSAQCRACLGVAARSTTREVRVSRRGDRSRMAVGRCSVGGAEQAADLSRRPPTRRHSGRRCETIGAPASMHFVDHERTVDQDVILSPARLRVGRADRRAERAEGGVDLRAVDEVGVLEWHCREARSGVRRAAHRRRGTGASSASARCSIPRALLRRVRRTRASSALRVADAAPTATRRVEDQSDDRRDEKGRGNQTMTSPQVRRRARTPRRKTVP